MTGTHCKDPSHLNVGTTEASSSDAGPGTTTAELVSSCECVNHPDYTGWCVVISHNRTDPDVGMHLMPDAAAWLPDELRRVAGEQPADGIVLSHTVRGVFKPYRTFTPAGAVDLAGRIDAVRPA